MARLNTLKATMRQALLNSVSVLDGIPPGEHIVLGVTLFYRSWENRQGLPSQVIMQAPKQTLQEFRNTRGATAPFDAAVIAAIQTWDVL
jgi:hypothetical protein